MSQMTLAARVRRLVALRHPEGCLAASRAIGIPNPTLHKILEGASENPRARTLQAIARHFDTTVGWLLSGDGVSPPLLAEHEAIAMELRLLSHSVRLSPTQRRAIEIALARWEGDTR